MRIVTPSGPTWRNSASASRLDEDSSSSRRFPLPRTTGKTISRSSSTRSASKSARTSEPLPWTTMSPPAPSRRAATSSRPTTCELAQTASGSVSVEETTYLVEPLNLSANSPSREGQCFANSSKVRRPSSIASEPIVSSSLNLSPSSPRSKRNAQPPPSRSSDPPGSSKTPSSVTNSVTTTRAIVSSFDSSLRGRTAGARKTHRPLGGHRSVDRCGGVEHALEQLAVAFDLDPVPAPLREQVVEGGRRRLEDDVGVLRRRGGDLGIDECRDFVADPELERSLRSDGREERVQ